MTEVKVGSSYFAKAVKHGTNEHGDWEMVIVKGDGRRQPTIAISVLNVPCGIGANGAFRVDEIKSVMHRNWKDPTGEWRAGNVTVRAKLTGLPNLETSQQIDVDGMFVETEFGSLEDYFNNV